ncbi:HAD-IC family P-type ATPase, partial [Chroococcidiopsidales cyanobacterium LEGE 13417]|nr:HAD-IC family P-type ATPase [Chroococcidiopsidales cyanobacterium LEGE 13417]
MSATPHPNPSHVWHALEVDKTIQVLESNAEAGLSSSQVKQRLEEYGANELQESGGRSPLAILIDQFKNIMLLMLIAVAIVSAVLDIRNNDFPKDAIAISLIVVLNGILGYVQESRAEKALAALKKLSAPLVRVMRDGKLTEVAAKELVPGDIMLIEAGVQLAADGRIIEESNLQIRESALTGESHAVEKQADIQVAEETSLGDRVNLVYQGTEVTQGRAKVIVTGTGMQTELGKIAALLQGVESEPTPLQQRMSQLGNVLVAGAMILVALVVVGGVLRLGWDAFEELLQVSLSMAVAVVPEGLPAVITVTLALGTQRMVKRNALIRKLPAVETLGSVTTICSDKTGTLTQNKMVVQAVELNQKSLRVTGEGYAPQGEFLSDGRAIDADRDPDLQALLVACALCNDSFLQEEQGHWKIVGDPTEGALVTLAAKAGIQKDQWSSRLPRVAEFPFSSERKRMSVMCQTRQEVRGERREVQD